MKVCRKLAKKGCQKNLGKLGQQCHYMDDGETLHWPKHKHSKVQVWVQWFVSHYTLAHLHLLWEGFIRLQFILSKDTSDTSFGLKYMKVRWICNVFVQQSQSMAFYLICNIHISELEGYMRVAHLRVVKERAKKIYVIYRLIYYNAVS